MIRSMTGFGESAAEVDGIAYTIEIRTVNNRYYKSHIRLADVAAFMESDVDKALRRYIQRGSVNFSLRMKNISGQAFFEVDENMFGKYLHQLESAGAGSSLSCNVDLASILNLPGVIQTSEPDEQYMEQIRRVVMDLSGQALDQLKEMRSAEGKALAEDLLNNCEAIEKVLDEINLRNGAVVSEYYEKLKKRADDLLSNAKLSIDQDTLSREVAVFADRCDIAEEVARLRSHLEQFRKHCLADDNAGRRLDFISQEMLREANTIGSKSSDRQISQWVIDIKCLVDRIKEQVQNVE